MKTIIEKKEYILPQIEQVPLDNEISLALESSPPAGPDEVLNNAPDHFNNPFKGNWA